MIERPDCHHTIGSSATPWLVRSLAAWFNEVSALAFSPDGKVLAAYYADGETRLWDIGSALFTGTLKPTSTGTTGYINKMAFSPGGDALATCEPYGSDYVNSVDVRYADSGVLARTLSSRDLVYAVAFNPADDIMLATGEGPSGTSSGNFGTAHLWDVPSQLVTHTFTGHAAPASAVAFSPDGKTLATGSGDFTARLCKIA